MAANTYNDSIKKIVEPTAPMYRLDENAVGHPFGVEHGGKIYDSISSRINAAVTSAVGANRAASSPDNYPAQQSRSKTTISTGGLQDLVFSALESPIVQNMIISGRAGVTKIYDKIRAFMDENFTQYGQEGLQDMRAEGSFVTDYYREEPVLMKVLEIRNGAIHTVFKTDKFFLQAMSHASKERAQIIRSSMNDFVITYGKDKPIWSITMAIPNGNLVSNWADRFMNNYDKMLRGSQTASTNRIVSIEYESMTLYGHIINMSVGKNAGNPRSSSVSISFFEHRREPKGDLKLSEGDSKVTFDQTLSDQEKQMYALRLRREVLASDIIEKRKQLLDDANKKKNLPDEDAKPKVDLTKIPFPKKPIGASLLSPDSSIPLHMYVKMVPEKTLKYSEDTMILKRSYSKTGTSGNVFIHKKATVLGVNYTFKDTSSSTAMEKELKSVLSDPNSELAQGVYARVKKDEDKRLAELSNYRPLTHPVDTLPISLARKDYVFSVQTLLPDGGDAGSMDFVVRRGKMSADSDIKVIVDNELPELEHEMVKSLDAYVDSSAIHTVPTAGDPGVVVLKKGPTVNKIEGSGLSIDNMVGATDPMNTNVMNNVNKQFPLPMCVSGGVL